jgi:hypothetical protein
MRRGDLSVELTALLHEVRATGGEISRAARSRQGLAQTPLQRLLEQWIANTDSRQKVVCFACAAELGVQLDPASQADCLQAARKSSALNALFWAAMRRLPTRKKRSTTDESGSGIHRGGRP